VLATRGSGRHRDGFSEVGGLGTEIQPSHYREGREGNGRPGVVRLQTFSAIGNFFSFRVRRAGSARSASP